MEAKFAAELMHVNVNTAAHNDEATSTHNSMTDSRQGTLLNIAGAIIGNTGRSQANRNQEQTNNRLQAASSGMNDCISGDASSPNQTHRSRETATHRYTVLFPALLTGARCYTDASTMPDQASFIPRKAGIGIFIINTQVQPPQNIYIKAAMQDSASVLMAEAAALALAAAVTARLQIQHTNFLTDNQELVHFLNSSDHSNPPDWRIKHLTQLFINFSQNRDTTTFKIKKESESNC